MRPGQRVLRWWQDYVGGRLSSPSDIYREAVAGIDHGGALASERFLDDPIDGAVFDVPERLAALSMLLPSPTMLRQWDKADWQQVDARLAYWAAMLQEAARKRRIPLYVHCAWRGRAEQDAAVKRGVSKTLWPYSAHNVGAAVDVVHGVYHWDMTPLEWRFIHKLGLRCLDTLNSTLPVKNRLSLEWGGDWSFYDPAHWQVSGYRPREMVTGDVRRLTPRYVLRHLKP